MRDPHPHCLRVAVENWEDPVRFAALLRLLETYPGGIGQVALFTSAVHSPLPLSEISRRAAIMKDRLARIREAGLVPAVNILATVGHHEEDLGSTPAGDYDLLTGADGRVCRGSVCMNDERWREEYVVPVYRMLAEARPSVIWVDDDIRYGHLPVGNGCFCADCLALFNRENGTSFTRESLTDKLESGDPAVRRAWLKHNGDAICRLLQAIGDAVRSVDPQIRLGFMTGERYFESYAFGAFAEALSDGGRYPILWRPGGGAYEDISFDAIMEKSEQIGRQNALLPACVTESLSEVENFPYQLIRKTPVSTALEGAWSMTAGCTGAAFNILPSETGEPVENAASHLCAIEDMRPFCELLTEKTAGQQPVGIGTAWRQNDQLAIPSREEGGSFLNGSGGMYASFARELFDFGLPQSYRPDRSLVTLLTGGCLRVMAEEEIAAMLEGGVYMDISALAALNAEGFAPLTGFEPGPAFPADARERYAAHPLNKEIEGGIRNCRQAFHPGDAYSLIPASPGAQILSDLIDYHGRVLADCCLGVFDNEASGHVAAAGYYPFSWLSDARKTAQLKRLMVRLSDERLPSYVETYCRVRNHTFPSGGKTVVAMCNPTNQPIEDLTVAVRTNADDGVYVDQQCVRTDLRGEERMAEQSAAYRRFRIPLLPPFGMGLLEVPADNGCDNKEEFRYG